VDGLKIVSSLMDEGADIPQSDRHMGLRPASRNVQSVFETVSRTIRVAHLLVRFFERLYQSAGPKPACIRDGCIVRLPTGVECLLNLSGSTEVDEQTRPGYPPSGPRRGRVRQHARMP
jgi:hypothetical protein